MPFSRRPDLIDRWLDEYFVVVTLVAGVLGAALLVVGFGG